MKKLSEKLKGTDFNQFLPSVVFHIEISRLFCLAKQMTGFYMKRNTGLKWVKPQRMTHFIHFWHKKFT